MSAVAESAASSTCPYCGESTPHSHDRCPECDAPAVQVKITENRCECMKCDDGFKSIHGFKPWERGVQYGECWSCGKLMPYLKWVHVRPSKEEP